MELKQLNPQNFDEVIYDNCEDCLVIFSRKGCHVCQEMVPILADMSPRYEGQFGFYRVDVEEDKELFTRFSLKGVPQILFFYNGEYHGKLVGRKDEKEVAEHINKLVGTAVQDVTPSPEERKRGLKGWLNRVKSR